MACRLSHIGPVRHPSTAYVTEPFVAASIQMSDGFELSDSVELELRVAFDDKEPRCQILGLPPELLRLLQEDPSRLRSLTPDQFETFVAQHLDRMEYNVTLTGPTNRKDGGIDLIAVPKVGTVGSVIIAGQVKHHSGDQKTGRDAVDRLLSWKDSIFHIGLLVTNTCFTHDAVWTAQQDRNARFLRLRDFADLKRWLDGQFVAEEDWRELPEKVELAPGLVISIPRPRTSRI